MCWLRAMGRAVRRGGCIVGDEHAELKEVGVWMFNFTTRLPGALARSVRGMDPLFVNAIHPGHGCMFWVSSKWVRLTAWIWVRDLMATSPL
jgi:hypothetical protein